jgi:hypothetical protein
MVYSSDIPSLPKLNTALIVVRFDKKPKDKNNYSLTVFDPCKHRTLNTRSCLPATTRLGSWISENQKYVNGSEI